MQGWKASSALLGSASTRALVVALSTPIALASPLMVPGMSAAFAGALPSAGHYVSGSGAISKKGSTGLTVNQSSGTGIIDWSSFSIGKGNTVRFDNGSGATLNRVMGGNLSRIAGSLSATGSVYLINTQGVIVSRTGRVNTGGGFFASSRDQSDSDFLNNKRKFSGTSKGNVVNEGHIRSANGDVALIGHAVSNSGTLSAKNGTASLNAANHVLLRPEGSPILIRGGLGDASNSGTITAAQAQLNAAGGNVYALAGNNDGIVRATGTQTRDGHVWLTSRSGDVSIAGRIVSHDANGAGGAVDAAARNITLASGAHVDAAATAPRGDGGKVSIIAAAKTKVAGHIAAGGGGGAKGGVVETSGRNLRIAGTVDAGHGGSWLLDPHNLTVDSTAATTIDNSLNHGTSVTLKTTATGTSGPGVHATGPGDIIVASSLNWNGSAGLTMDAYRNVQINSGVTIKHTGHGSLVLAADNAALDSGTVVFKGTGKIDFSGATGNVTFYYHPGSYATPTDYKNKVSLSSKSKLTAYMTIDTAANLQAMNKNLTGIYALDTNINASGIANFVPVGSNSSDSDATRFNGTLFGNGHTITHLTIKSSGGAVGLFGGLGTKAKVTNLNLSSASITGTLDGSVVGAIAGKNEGLISAVTVGGSVKGAGDVIGGVVGDNGGTGRITGATSLAAVTDNDTAGIFAYVGGLVGENYHSIVNSSATKPVTELAGTESDIGGLVGWNDGGAISGSFATGNVTTNSSGDFDDVGGLVGRSGYTGTSTITGSYAEGAVSAGGYDAIVGGLVGAVTQTSSVTSSHATGSVTGSGQLAFVGGLVGDVTDTTGSVVNSHASGNVTGGPSSNDGSLIGSNAGTVSGSSATGSVSGGAGSCIGGLIGYPGGAGAGCE